VCEYIVGPFRWLYFLVAWDVLMLKVRLGHLFPEPFFVPLNFQYVCFCGLVVARC